MCIIFVEDDHIKWNRNECFVLCPWCWDCFLLSKKRCILQLLDFLIMVSRITWGCRNMLLYTDQLLHKSYFCLDQLSFPAGGKERQGTLGKGLFWCMFSECQHEHRKGRKSHSWRKQNGIWVKLSDMHLTPQAKKYNILGFLHYLHWDSSVTLF